MPYHHPATNLEKNWNVFDTGDINNPDYIRKARKNSRKKEKARFKV